MKRQPILLYGVLLVAIAIVFGLILRKQRTVATDHPTTETQSAPAGDTQPTEPSPPPSEITFEPEFESATEKPQAARNRLPDEPVSEYDMTPFLRSEVAAKWVKELGYRTSELVQAQKEIRAAGYPESAVNDPGVIQRFLPPRHMGNVSIKEIDLPAEAAAGSPIPFTIKGTAPSPTFQFTHFDVLVQGDVIRITARGNSDGDNEAGLGEQITLEGEIEPLPRGEYRVVVPELGPLGTHTIVVTEP